MNQLSPEEYVSGLVVSTLAPLIQKLQAELGAQGMSLLGTSVTTAGIALLRDNIGNGKTAEFLNQLSCNLQRR